MTRRVLATLGVVALLMTLTVPAFAGNTRADSSPAQLCKGWYETREQDRPTGTEDVTAYWVPMAYPGFQDDLPILSLGGCVSTVANGGGVVPVPFDALSTAAVNSQCKMLERAFIDYPYNFYGNPDYLANNRADCIYFLRAFHLGQLPPGPG